MQIIYECLLPAQLHVFIVKSNATLLCLLSDPYLSAPLLLEVV